VDSRHSRHSREGGNPAVVPGRQAALRCAWVVDSRLRGNDGLWIPVTPVIPAKAGIQLSCLGDKPHFVVPGLDSRLRGNDGLWIPACAGMTDQKRQRDAKGRTFLAAQSGVFFDSGSGWALAQKMLPSAVGTIFTTPRNTIYRRF
jgi:hypothetical protein